MNARFLTTAALLSVLSGILPAKAADPQLLNLVMPDAKVLAGVNVDQAKTSPMGQYVLNQIQASGNANELQKFATLTGFDPTRDIHEVLVATTAVAQNQQSGLLLARGNFDPARISAFLTMHNGQTETYNGVTIITDPKGQGGIAFLSSTIAAGGDMANLKAAIDRQRTPTSLPAAVAVRVNQWSSAQDAWAISTVPPSSFNFIGMPPIPGAGSQPNQIQNAFTGIQNMSGGVKFGANVVVTAQVQAATAQDATQLGDTLKLLASLAQLQANGDPNVLALAQSLNVSTNASVLNVTLSMPQDQIVAIIKQGPKHAAPKQLNRKQ